MPMDLSPIRTIVVVMMENRSFDHLLGYLSLPPFKRNDVDGLSTDPAWLARFTNTDQGQPCSPQPNLDPYDMPKDFDPPHERSNIATQIGGLKSDGTYPMTGFVSAIPTTVSADPATRRLVVDYFGSEQVPMSHFFSRNYTICDRWFASLPAGTQANRLMSMSGFSMIDVNHDLLPNQYLVYDWLNDKKVSWRVYHQGIPFFTMMDRWIPEILLSGHFRNFDDLQGDLMNTPPDELPQVIFIEPTYQDAPHLGFSTDEHAPSGVSNGQEFLMQSYNAVTNSRAFWQGVVMIVDYDEHGGFFDHVTPPLMATNPPAGATYADPFASLGVRTPAYVISPFVQPGVANHTILDHTSVLKLIGEKFGEGGSYSALVDARPVGSVSAVLNFDNPITEPPPPPALDDYLANRPPPPVGVTVPAQNTPLQQGFQKSVAGMRQNGAGSDHPKFGKLLNAMANAPQ